MSMDTIISVRKKGTTPVFVYYIHVLIQEYGHNYIKNKWPANPYKIKHALPIGLQQFNHFQICSWIQFNRYIVRSGSTFVKKSLM